MVLFRYYKGKIMYKDTNKMFKRLISKRGWCEPFLHVFEYYDSIDMIFVHGGSLLTFDYVWKFESDTYSLSCVMHHYKFVNFACIFNTSHIHKREHWGRIEI